MNDRLDISEIFLKGPLNPNQEKKKKKKNDASGEKRKLKAVSWEEKAPYLGLCHEQKELLYFYDVYGSIKIKIIIHLKCADKDYCLSCVIRKDQSRICFTHLSVTPKIHRQKDQDYRDGLAEF